MYRHELTDEQARTHLATSVRNAIGAEGTISTAWVGLELLNHGGTFYRIQNGARVEVAPVNDLLGKSDEELEALVLGLPKRIESVSPLAAPATRTKPTRKQSGHE